MIRPYAIDNSCALYEMNAADFDELSESKKRHFYKCEQCGEMVDMRELDDVLFHETDHKPRSGSRPFDQFYCGNWLSPLPELAGCGRSVPILAKR